MNRAHVLKYLAAFGAIAGLVLIGCHADANDPAGQAGELSDPVRRANAVANLTRLYTSALSEAGGDRAAEGPRSVADASIEPLTRAYIEYTQDNQNRRRMLDLLYEMQDPRAMEAFIAALDWRQEVSEEHAIRAAQAIERMEIPDGQRESVATALGEALDKVQGNRGVDNRMRIHFIRAIGALRDRRNTSILTKVAGRLSEDQNFLINRMAAEELGALGDPAAVPAMVRGLVIFAPNAPQMRMNDVAAQALVQIGRPALEPLVATLRGENQDAERIATQYIAAVRQRNEAAAESMDARTIVASEACYALGQLGFREAIDPMMEHITPFTSLSVREAEEANEQVFSRAMGCALALVSINRTDADIPRVRDALIRVYERSPKLSRPQILVAMQHTYDAGLLDFLHTQARTPEEELPDIRVLAYRSYAFLANRDEVARLRQVMEREPPAGEGGFRRNFAESDPALAAAEECHEDVACWIGKLGDSDAFVVRKAAYMLGRYGRGNDAAIAALVERIDHRDQNVRGDVLYAIDWNANQGSEAAVAKIDEVRQAEEGRSSWNQIKELALAIRARLHSRAS